MIRAEALRLRTVRTYWLLAAGTIALITAASAAAAASQAGPASSAARSVLAIAGVAQTVALIAGVLAVTGEFRHKTITPAVLITPRRTPLLAAKLAVLTVAGLVFGLVATGVAAAVTLPLLRQASLSAAAAAGIVAGGGIATALAAALGVGVGAIVRNQVGAIVTVLAVLYVAEPSLGLVPHLGPAIQTYGLTGLVTAITRTTGYAHARLLGEPAAVLVLAGYAAAALAAGAVLLRRRDIPA